tara:strand:- start:2733 stop:3161 length:429 start_codon:yes stop_codon:yes gene_type:complete
MPIEDSQANFVAKSGDSDSGLVVPRMVPVIRQSDDTAEDLSNTNPLPVISGFGLPVLGTDATGADAYATVVTAPARECHFVHIAVESNGATVSLDAGTTDHFAIPPNTSRLFDGLVIASGVAIQGKNLSAGNNFTNLRISVW